MSTQEPPQSPELSEEIEREFSEISKSAVDAIDSTQDPASLEAARVATLGMKGSVTRLFERIPKLDKSLRRAFGQRANALRAHIEARHEARKVALDREALDRELKGPKLDVTLPGRRAALGHRHPVSRTLDDVSAIFLELGFDVAEGPEIELDDYNFEALNIPADHPARDMQDTFWVAPESLGAHDAGALDGKTVVLRTHTSPVQIRTMLAHAPPIRIIAPGKVYRCDSDVTHTPMFHQVEGLLVDKGVTFAELKGTLDAFVRSLFGASTRTRFRPSYFPFTEPSAEVDISCVHCGGKGCRICKQTGWLEILGAGMVHPNVFRAVGYDPSEVSGFAFGLGVERIAMLRYGVDDLRSFFENDARFLEQF
ncbi:MAG: phenylalanine--tRNA ligase subunit alpha [Myxococcales bacterium]|nr:phenylalanine--tRNA ligase subunit alpha [Myxococcales bacterium]